MTLKAGDFVHADDGTDPLIGRDGSNTLRRPDARAVSLDFRQFVATSGAVYALAPSISTLRGIAAGAL